MCLEAVNCIKAAEEESLRAILLADDNARNAVEEAVANGKETVAATLARAESEVAHLKRMTDQKAAAQASELVSTTANRQATLRARAERRLDTVAGMIIERIMNAE